MTIRTYQEVTCDRCGALHQTSITAVAQLEAPLPHGWSPVRLGQHAPRQLCDHCTPELRKWLGIEAEQAVKP